jgi:DNA repair protein RadC
MTKDNIITLLTSKDIKKKVTALYETLNYVNQQVQDKEQRKYNNITTPDRAYTHILSHFDKNKLNWNKEHVIIICLNIRNRVNHIETVSTGTLTASLLHPREVFSIAILNNSAQIIIAHNHPSEETEPSEDDLKITKRLQEIGKIMGIEVTDHLIFTPNNYLSFNEKNLM